MVFLLSDSATPLVLGADPLNQPRLHAGMKRSEPRMKLAALRALDAEAPVHTFALGEATSSDVPHALTRIAGATGGRFSAVEDPSRLHCHLRDALDAQVRRSAR